MRVTAFSGDYYIWTLGQAAVAAARYPGYPPTQEGLNQLQAAWANSGERSPLRDSDSARDVNWANQAFRDVASRQLKYEQVCA